MISPGIFVMLVLAMCICFIVPLSFFVILEKKRLRIVRSFWMGALSNFLGECLLMIFPFLLWRLHLDGWYGKFSTENIWGYAFFAAAMTAVCGGVVRFLIIKFGLKGQNRWLDAVSMGVGQGVLTSFLMTKGLSDRLFAAIALNNGVLADYSGQTGLQLARMEMELCSLDVVGLLFDACNVLCFILMQIGYSVMMYKGVKGKRWGLIPIAIVWQMIPNVLSVLLLNFTDAATRFLQGELVLTSEVSGISSLPVALLWPVKNHNFWLMGAYILLAAVGLLYAFREKNASVWGTNVEKNSSFFSSGRQNKPTKSIKDILKQMPK